MADGSRGDALPGSGLLPGMDDGISAAGGKHFLSGGSSGHGRHLFAVHSGQHCHFKTFEKQQKVLLSGPAFYQCLRPDLPDETKCGGAGQYLYSEYGSAAGSVHHRLPVFWNGGLYGDAVPKPNQCDRPESGAWNLAIGTGPGGEDVEKGRSHRKCRE